MKRFATDLVLATSIAALPLLTDAARVETARMAFLGTLYALAAVLSYARLIRKPEIRRALDVAVALGALAIGWLQSFPAGSHSTEVGFYIVFGASVMLVALWPRPAARPDTEAQRLRSQHQSLLAVWQ
ncbi:MAG TPA: hypothetical protein VGR02_17370 [Thermoanaerobaculia bacterium]|jgi:hypothetical protein|nr:hypothetical protein [Thermoanaerobaculia bacterium]